MATPTVSNTVPTDQDRLQQCFQEINKILVEYGCELVGIPSITPEGRIVTNVQIAIRK